MRLYKMELFKLFQNKIFKIGMLATTGLLFLYFWFAEVGGEIATVDGKFYSGYEAVRSLVSSSDIPYSVPWSAG